MLICGLKLTHDGAVALIEDGKLLFSIEMEKRVNNLRYTEILETSVISEILREFGYAPADIDYFAIDGWGGDDKDSLAVQPRLEIGKKNNRLAALNNGEPYRLDIGQYEEMSVKDNILREWQFSGLKLESETVKYLSYYHAAGHVLGSYMTSSFAAKGESSYILVWDGGMFPRLYFYDAGNRKIENLGPIFMLIGNFYTIFSQHFGPFKVKGNFAKDNLSVAGKVMAYVALGKPKRELFSFFDNIINDHYSYPMGFGNVFANEFKKHIEGKKYTDEDILATFHLYLEEMLVSKLKKKISRYDRKSRNLCIAGGCALNIKWNSAVRGSGLFDEVYVPPFPNDSGSAIGAACCVMANHTNKGFVDWTVYSGPQIIHNAPAAGWKEKECSLERLAQILHESSEPVVFLNGKTELGPRALGNRSILATVVLPEMKDILNSVKIRESYRPVSPICLEEKAKEIFTPGRADPYMLFDHMVKKEWVFRIPAVIHLDGSARLQTVNRRENPVVAELLDEYDKISGIPLLCNTSANLKGHGFFPDVYSATNWNKVNYVWCGKKLYEKEEKVSFAGLIK